MFTQQALRLLIVFVVLCSGCAATTSHETIQVGQTEDELPERIPFESPTSSVVPDADARTEGEGEGASPIPDFEGAPSADRVAGRTPNSDPDVTVTTPVSPEATEPTSVDTSVAPQVQDEPLPVEQTAPPTSSSSPAVGDTVSISPTTTVSTSSTPAVTTPTTQAPVTQPTSTSTAEAPAATSTSTTTQVAASASPSSASSNLDPFRPPFVPALSAQGWIVPNPGVNVGHPGSPARSHLLDFVAPNDGPYGVTIDSAFLASNSGAPWLLEENGRVVISGINADQLCLNITVPLTLRNSYVNCPTRTQSSRWGWAGDVNDTPAVNILGASGVVIEFNTITCSGFDGDICGRSVRVSGVNATVRYNDLSFARGAVKLADGTRFVHNYLHSFSFGFDPRRASNPNDRVTHNNAVNSYGYENTLVEGNYIVARYGRVSRAPTAYTNPYFHNVYSGGVVRVGDPINGFAFVNYLYEGSGAGSVTLRNYVEGAGRAFLCQGSSTRSGAVCAADMSFNAFADDMFGVFRQVPVFQDLENNGAISGRCNGLLNANGTIEVFGADAFGSVGQHGTSGC